MADSVLFDPFHLSFFLPTDIPPEVVDAARQALDDSKFLGVLRDAVRRVLDADPDLAPLTIEISL